MKTKAVNFARRERAMLAAKAYQDRALVQGQLPCTQTGVYVAEIPPVTIRLDVGDMVDYQVSGSQTAKGRVVSLASWYDWVTDKWTREAEVVCTLPSGESQRVKIPQSAIICKKEPGNG